MLKKIFNFYTLICFLVSAVIFFVIGFEFSKNQQNTNNLVSNQTSIREVRESTFGQNNFKYINPLLTCEITSSTETKEFAPLKNKINSLISIKLKNDDAAFVSVYFDTRDGRWLSINPDETYDPASLLKVPLMIAVFKVAEENPAFLSKKILYTGVNNLNDQQNFKPAQILESGHYYTVDDLVRRMIVYSDNNAVPLLLNNMNSSSLTVVYDDLGFSNSSADTKVKSYARFFKVLYNGTYLSREMSEKALEYLTESDFHSGIAASVPSTISVANKFGERNTLGVDGQSTLKELHDCGIIYYSNHPYLLCIMTKGDGFDKQAKTISDISALVYQNISNSWK